MKDNYMELVNKYTRRKFEKDEVFVFDVVLCDDRVDRDHEAFSDRSLMQMKDLFIGKTGIFDHDPKGEKQTARIFDTYISTEDSSEGKYKKLNASCYMVRTDKNSDLIKEIDGGIKKEVSVSCSVEKKICCICGKEEGKCRHIRGKVYGGKECYYIIDNVKDAYEWSFVAVPAQRGAGVTKRYGGGENVFNPDFNISFNNVLKSGFDEEIKQMLRKNIVKMAYNIYGENYMEILEHIFENADVEELYSFEINLEKLFKSPNNENYNNRKEDLGRYKI